MYDLWILELICLITTYYIILTHIRNFSHPVSQVLGGLETIASPSSTHLSLGSLLPSYICVRYIYQMLSTTDWVSMYVPLCPLPETAVEEIKNLKQDSPEAVRKTAFYNCIA